ncbi:MAG: (d)CMP kinase, partial [Sporolactobacillus sp.]
VRSGRDIGTHVLPHADVKIIMKASGEDRAMRRFKEEELNGRHPLIEELKTAIASRDKKDMERAVSPLIQANDAIVLDTTALTINQVVAEILRIVKARRSV